MSSEIHIGEAMIIIFSGLALLATFAIMLIAFRLSSDLSNLRQEIRDLNGRLDEADQTEGRFNFQSEMLLILASNLYRTNALFLAFFRRQREIDRVAKIDLYSDAYEILINELAHRNMEATENIDFFRVLVDPNEDAIQALIDKRPTKNTALFLDKLARVAPKASKSSIGDKFRALSARLLEFYSSRWTGREP